MCGPLRQHSYLSNVLDISKPFQQHSYLSNLLDIYMPHRQHEPLVLKIYTISVPRPDDILQNSDKKTYSKQHKPWVFPFRQFFQEVQSMKQGHETTNTKATNYQFLFYHYEGLSFDFAISLGTFRFEFSSEFSIFVIYFLNIAINLNCSAIIFSHRKQSQLKSLQNVYQHLKPF